MLYGHTWWVCAGTGNAGRAAGVKCCGSHGSSQSPHRGQLPLLTFMCEVIKLGHELFGQLNKGGRT
eukprot:1159578-Pelagomonas_calceolata.AAC.6